MRIKKLTIRNLYGSLSKRVTFGDDLNLLVGINGSGKTSVLYIVDWLLRPNLPRLATTQFEYLRLELESEGRNVSIEARQDAKELQITYTVDGRKMFPLQVTFLAHPSLVSEGEELDDMLKHYSQLGPDKRERPIWKALSGIPKPVVISLDRTISAEVDDHLYLESNIPSQLRRSRIESPLVKVRQVTLQRYARYRSKVIALNDELKARVVVSAFRDPAPSIRPGKSAPKVSRKEIEALESKVIEYLSTSIKRGKPQIHKFFRRLTALTDETSKRSAPHRDIVWGMFSNQFRQIDDLTKAFNKFETRSAAAYAELKLYLDTVNLFLRDSGKIVTFNEGTNSLGFRFLDGSGRPHSKMRGIEHLSSGERQILILFTFLSFVSTPDQVFIVDEPELSLHPKWQSEFVDAFLKLKPPSTQLVMATHSPEIVGRHKSACVVLLP